MLILLLVFYYMLVADSVHAASQQLASPIIHNNIDNAPASTDYSTLRHFRFRHSVVMTSSSTSHVTRRTATRWIYGRRRAVALYGRTRGNVAPPTSKVRTYSQKDRVISRSLHKPERQSVDDEMMNFFIYCTTLTALRRRLMVC